MKPTTLDIIIEPDQRSKNERTMMAGGDRWEIEIHTNNIWIKQGGTEVFITPRVLKKILKLTERK